MIPFFLFTLFAAIASASDLVLYWGQASAGSQKRLSEYCSSTDADIYVISFLSGFSGTDITLNIAGYYDTFEGSTLLHASQVGEDIKACQAAGKKVLLSLGGGTGSYGLSDDAAGVSLANTLWTTFGAGSDSSVNRPFDDAVVDGFDLDIETGIQTGYTALVNQLRTNYATDSSKQYYVSAAPQCPYPDASVGDVLANADIDFAFIQFYNNYCSLTGSSFNWDTWQSYASNTSPNKNIKLFLGLPGGPSAAGSGYATPDQVSAAITQIKSSGNFGGVMLWDASQGDTNQVNGESFIDAIIPFLKDAPASSTVASSAAATTSSAAASSSAAAGVSTSAPGASTSAAPGVTTSSDSGNATSSAGTITTSGAITTSAGVTTSSGYANDTSSLVTTTDSEGAATTITVWNPVTITVGGVASTVWQTAPAAGTDAAGSGSGSGSGSSFGSGSSSGSGSGSSSGSGSGSDSGSGSGSGSSSSSSSSSPYFGAGPYANTTSQAAGVPVTSLTPLWSNTTTTQTTTETVFVTLASTSTHIADANKAAAAATAGTEEDTYITVTQVVYETRHQSAAPTSSWSNGTVSA